MLIIVNFNHATLALFRFFINVITKLLLNTMNDSINQGCAGGDSTIIVITTKNECCTLLEIYKPLSFILYYLCIAYTEGQKHYNTGTKNQEKSHVG